MSYFEEDGSEPFDPIAVFTRCVESGCHALLLDHEALPAEFFDLSSGVAGEFARRTGARTTASSRRAKKP